MSGDVQPRKRKDKKRRKDDTSENTPPQQPPQTPPTPSNLTDNVNIHVYKEEGTGGGICAKIVFFILFSTLAVLIGLIITEHRGLTDLDTTQSESRFSQLFEGWIDNSPNHEDEHSINYNDLENDDDDLHHSEEDNEINKSEEEVDEEHLENSSQDENDDEDEETEEADANEDEDETLESEEQKLSEEEDDNNDSNEEDSNDIENSEENNDDKDEVDDQLESSEANDKSEEQNGEENDEEEEEKKYESDKKSSSKEIDNENVSNGSDNLRMAVKIGVGIALLVVAHIVLVKKRISAPLEPPVEDKDIISNLTRRNTIVVPPTYQEVEQDIEETVEEDYSDEDGETESEEEENKSLKQAKMKYQELRSTYSRSLTPDSDLDIKKKTTDYDNEEYDEEIDEEESEDGEDDDDDEEETETEEEDDDDDDEELLKRLEAKYGRVPQKTIKNEDDDDQMSSWKYVNIASANAETGESDSDKSNEDNEDIKIKDKLDEAQNTIQNNAAYAVKLFDLILQKYPNSSRGLYGKAQALDILADQKKSNNLLQQAIDVYLKLLNLGNVPAELFKMASNRCINRMRFIGQYNNVINVHNKLIKRFPDVIKYQNELARRRFPPKFTNNVSRVKEARLVLKEILLKSPNDGFALVHYGFILKTVDNNLNESIKYLSNGIKTRDPGVIDGRFYFHLGDALIRSGKVKEALEIYEEGVRYKLFLSKYQRSLYNVPRLKGKPWWEKNETPYNDLYLALEKNWEKIRNEALTILNEKGSFQNESENLKNFGNWKQFELFARGQINVENCKKCPITCNIIKRFPDAATCKRGQTKFSVMHPGTHVWTHCGPTNCRLRIHLGLKVPSNTFIRVGEETRSWKEGKVFIFDDSFEHEVWHNGTETRLVLIIDVWHPELTPLEKKSLSPI